MPSITGASRLAAILTVDIKPFLRNIEIANIRLQKFQAQAQALGSGLLRSVGLGFGLLGAGALSVAEKFSEITSQLRAIGGSTAMEPVIDAARELGRTTKFTSTEVAELALSLKKLGFDAQGIQGAMKTATKLTQLFGGDLNKVGSTIAEVRRQFGLTEEEGSFERIGDVFAVAFRESALDINNLGGALKNVGTVANQSGLTLEKTIALLGGLANQGQKAERAGTRLKTTLVRLGREFGFTEDQTGILTSGVLDTAQIFDLLKNRAGLAGAVIAQSGAEINLLEERLINAKGALDAMSEGLDTQLFISVARAKAGVEDLSISLGGALAPYVAAVADGLQYLAKKFDESSDKTKDSIANFSVMAVVVPIAITAVAGLAAALLALEGPIVLISLGIGVLVGAYTKAALKAARIAREQERLNETFANFRELTRGEDGESFDPGGIAATSTGALEQLAARQEESLKALRLQKQEIEDEITERVNRPSLNSQIAVDKEILKDSGETKQIQAEINRLISQQFVVKKELEQREDRLRDLAAERLDLQQRYADSLGFSQQILLKFQNGWEKTGDNIAKALAEFGFATEDLGQIQGKLEQIQNLSLADIVDGGADVFKGLTDGLKGTPEQLKKLSDALNKQIKALGIEGAIESGEEFANIFLEAAKSYKDFSDDLARQIKINGIEEASDKAVDLAESLTSLGRVTEQGFNERKLSALTTELNALLAQDVSTSSNRIKDLNKEIEDLEETISASNLADKLKKVLEAPETFDEFANTDPLVAFEQAAARAGREARGLFADFQAGGTTTLEQVNAAVKEFLDADLVARTQKEAAGLKDSLSEVPAELQKIEDALSGGFIDRNDEASQRLQVLTKQVEDLLALQKLDGIGDIVFSDEDLNSLNLAIESIDKLKIKIRDMEKAAQLTSFIKDQVDFLGQAFLEASQSGENFFTVLKRTFLDAFRALVAKLITLIILFTILSIVAGGSGAGAGVAKQALGGADAFSGAALGNVLSAGFGLSKSLSVGSGPAGSSGSGLAAGGRTAITGSLSGDNIVFSNQRGTRAIDRTFG